jgi:hypothetical protein
MPLLPFRTLMTLTELRMRFSIMREPRARLKKAEPQISLGSSRLDGPEDVGKSLGNPKNTKAA